MRIAKSYKLDEATVGLLSGQENAGRYIDAIVQRAHRRSVRAINLMLIRGWSTIEITEAVTALNSALDCVDDPSYHSTTMSRHRPATVPELRWAILKNEVACDMQVAVALDTVATEWWDGNSHIRGILSDGFAAELPAALEA
jgi:hypothetical protein